ncbi:hypothetical protein GTP45_12800 [Pseudoduganella sp. FT55W]|uniref:Serine protease n=1 Tax=Duganella rivi TaxID=2666083 RepID=A0A7X4GQC8_9BURK|nr:hypothetical protein [Duganella rivi]MYM67708.1 hypothetical protein [Duganella rivi]
MDTRGHIFFLSRAVMVALTFLAMASAFCQESLRKPVDPSGTLAKLVGEVSQPQSELIGNAFIVGQNGCHIMTNLHVAYGKSKDMATGKVELFDELAVGHVVNFAFNLDAQTGRFKGSMTAKVIEFGSYQEGTKRGLVGDVAVLRLESCLGKEYGALIFDRPEPGQRTPIGRLKTISSVKMPDERRAIVSQEGCSAERITTVTGLFLSNCDMPPGSSGSMVLEEHNGKWHLVGMPVRQLTVVGETPVGIAIYVSALNKILDSALGKEGLPAGP